MTGPPPARRVTRSAPALDAATPPPSAPPVPPPPHGRTDDGKPYIRINGADNLMSILALTRRALRDAGRSDVEVGTATDDLLKARAGTYADVASKYVTVIR